MLKSKKFISPPILTGKMNFFLRHIKIASLKNYFYFYKIEFYNSKFKECVVDEHTP